MTEWKSPVIVRSDKNDSFRILDAKLSYLYTLEVKAWNLTANTGKTTLTEFQGPFSIGYHNIISSKLPWLDAYMNISQNISRNTSRNTSRK